MKKEVQQSNFTQLDYWRGEFGDHYTRENIPSDVEQQSRTRFWAQLFNMILSDPPTSILEVGPNLGVNLDAISRISNAKLYAVEPNATARASLLETKLLSKNRLLDGTAFDIALPNNAVDFAFTSGVLIHIDPKNLLRACREIDRVSRKYILCMEYFSDQPREIQYRGQSGLLFLRDFGNFWMDNFSQLKLRDYGFLWKRVTEIDNLNWWLFEKFD